MRRLRLYTYLTVKHRRTYLAIMREFTGTLLADLSAGDVAAKLAQAEREGLIGVGESHVDTVAVRISALLAYGNLVPGRRETNARTIAEQVYGSWRYQVTKLAIRVQREADAMLRVAEGAREVTRELLPAIEAGLADIAQTLSETLVAEGRGPQSSSVRALREKLATQVTTIFLQQDELAATVRDFYAHVGQIVARHDLNPEEIAGFRTLLVDYIQMVVQDVLRHTPQIAKSLTGLASARPELLRLLDDGRPLGEDTERSGGRSEADWQGFTDWFIDESGGRPSQVQQLREATARAVGTLLANVRRTTAGSVIAPGRRQDLLRLAAAAARCDQERADALHSALFALYPARHLLGEAEPGDSISSEPWSKASAITVAVSVAERPDRAGRGRAARVQFDPLGEQAAIEEGAEASRLRLAALTEIAAAGGRLAEVELSAPALRMLYDLMCEASSQRMALDETGTLTIAEQDAHLRISVHHDPAVDTTIRSRIGTLTMHATVLRIDNLGRQEASRHGC